MPPFASSKRPRRRWCASVNAPRSWPNSSDSRRVAGMAAQRDRDEGLPRPPAVVVDRAGDDLLARARLPAQEDRHVGARDPPDGLVHLLHAGGLADERPELPDLLDAGPELDDLAGERARRQGALGEEPHLVVVERLREVVVGPALHRLDGGADAPVGRHDDHRGVGSRGLQAGEHLEPVDLRHPHVDEREIVRLRRGVRERPGPVLDDGDGVAGLPQDALEEPAHRGLVVGDQDPRGGHRAAGSGPATAVGAIGR